MDGIKRKMITERIGLDPYDLFGDEWELFIDDYLEQLENVSGSGMTDNQR